MDLQAMFFQNWSGIVRTVLVGFLAYATLVAFLRISGKRTLAKLNAFDLVVTVALGSTLSAITLQESIALAEGAAALALLISLQYLVTFLSVRSQTFARAIRSEPTLLARSGEFCGDAMKRQRVTEAEALNAIRSSGGKDVSDVQFLVLESDGTIRASLLSDAAKTDPIAGRRSPLAFGRTPELGDHQAAAIEQARHRLRHPQSNPWRKRHVTQRTSFISDIVHRTVRRPGTRPGPGARCADSV